ncbi:NnrS family protein [Aromatoleum diolicum]|uniref:NnrS family protein n=1 Tax=Aromatoleum diolicum TaxID=75796 RepID=A0ABX1Q983_9RHOO|nr:NnrS family protein [Aromatoleum diolicum]NMG74868.1 NnrS family protein [Aromatoleum diolicum]
MQSHSALSQTQLVLFAAPHRSMFLSGGVVLLLTFAMWGLELASRVGLAPPVTWTLPPGRMHALLVTSAVFPLFMFGFLLTAMPRWQGYDDIRQARWLWPWRLLVAGWGLAVAGMLVGGLVVPGLLLVLCAWLGVVRILWQVAHHGELEALHARVVCYAMIAGAFALVAWLAFAVGGDTDWARIAIDAAVWWCLLPVFFSVCHRMVPFFSSSVIPAYQMVRPTWVLGMVVGGSAVHGLLTMANLSALAWVVDAPAAGAALWLSWRWRLVPALRVPLLGMLHIGFLWLGIALSLFAVQGLAELFGYHILGMAPLHALGVGFFGSVLMGMVSRVTLGHSGRKLAADRLTWGLFLGLEGVVMLRIAAELVPLEWSGVLMLVAVLGWLGVFGAWASRYLPIYWRPRSDGRPG